MEAAGLVTIDDQWISVQPAGRMLVRAIAMVFDRYLRADRERTRYSKVIWARRIAASVGRETMSGRDYETP